MKLKTFHIEGPIALTPQYHHDDRGYFTETFNTQTFNQVTGLDEVFVQDNESMSKKNVLRGLHFQSPPQAQGKLVRVLSGKIFDVAVDIRPGSPTFGQYISIVLDSIDGKQFWIPEGFAHGFIALEDHTKIAYKVTNFYVRDLDAGIAWDDETVAIEWPGIKPPIVSKKDKSLPKLCDL